MQKELLQFAITNPWSTLLTAATVMYAAIYTTKALLNEQIMRGIIIMIVLTGFLWTLSFFGVPKLTIWVDQDTFVYFLILSGVDGTIHSIYTYNNSKVTLEDEGLPISVSLAGLVKYQSRKGIPYGISFNLKNKSKKI